MSTIPLLAALGGLLAALSGLAFYVASPHQKLLSGPWPARSGWLPGALASVVSLPLLGAAFDTLAAVFVWATLLMTVLTVAPFVPLLRKRARP